MTEKTIRVAVVGVGEFGRNHVRVWRELPGVELVGVLDANASARGESRRRIRHACDSK